MADPDFMVALGIKSSDLVAGFAGGVVNAFVFQRANPLSIIGSVVVGALTAAYLSEPAAHFTGTSGGATSFIVGLGAMAICQSIVAQAAKWRSGNAQPEDRG